MLLSDSYVVVGAVVCLLFTQNTDKPDLDVTQHISLRATPHPLPTPIRLKSYMRVHYFKRAKIKWWPK